MSLSLKALTSRAERKASFTTAWKTCIFCLCGTREFRKKRENKEKLFLAAAMRLVISNFMES